MQLLQILLLLTPPLHPPPCIITFRSYKALVPWTNSLYSINLHLYRFSSAFQSHVTLIAFLKSLCKFAVSNCASLLSKTAILQRQIKWYLPVTALGSFGRQSTKMYCYLPLIFMRHIFPHLYYFKTYYLFPTH